jgi:predicted dehydrogenase
LGFVDKDENKRLTAAEKWDALCCEDISCFSSPASPDIISVCTPTETHERVLLDILKLNPLPKLVIAEKPFCENLQQASWVSNQYKAAGVPILVDYIRRFDLITAFTLDKIKNGHYGKVYHARCLYGRGLKRDGCHAVDIFNWVFGSVQGVMINHPGITDYLPFDPSYTVRLEYKTCSEVYLVAVDSRAWGCFEIDFITERGVIRFVDWGKEMRVYKPEEETTFGQYKALSPCAEVHRTNLHTALLYMVQNAVDFLDGNGPLLCTDNDALNVHRIIEGIGGKK